MPNLEEFVTILDACVAKNLEIAILVVILFRLLARSMLIAMALMTAKQSKQNLLVKSPLLEIQLTNSGEDRNRSRNALANGKDNLPDLDEAKKESPVTDPTKTG